MLGISLLAMGTASLLGAFTVIQVRRVRLSRRSG
jgi:hypothetical protein